MLDFFSPTASLLVCIPLLG